MNAMTAMAQDDVLGVAWGVWHTPIYGPAGFVIPMVLAFFYTVLWNRTHSVGLCVVLHASFTPAQNQLILMAHDKAYTTALDAPDWAILAVYLVAVIVVIIATNQSSIETERSPRGPQTMST